MKMTDVRLANLKLILEKICEVKPGDNLLVVADDYVRPISLASDFVDLANAMGADAVLGVFKRRTFIAEELLPDHCRSNEGWWMSYWSDGDLRDRAFNCAKERHGSWPSKDYPDEARIWGGPSTETNHC
jgi:hypothetical protein